MANEILYPAVAVGNFKAIVSKGATVWNGTSMVSTTAAAKALGAIAMTRQSTTLDYVATFPAGIVVAGKYAITVIDAVSPDGTEPSVGTGDLSWTGAAEDVPSDTALSTSLAAVKVKTDNLPADTNATLATIASYVDTEVAAIKAKTDNLPTVPANDATTLAVKVVTDKLGAMISGSGPFQYTVGALVNAPAGGGGGGSVQLDLTQAVPASNASGTVGEALAAARAQAFGKWTKSGTTLTLYAPDGTTVVRTFTLNDANAPTTRV